MQCTGTYYPEWQQEPAKFLPEVYIIFVCLVSYLILSAYNKVTKKKWEIEAPLPLSQKKTTNFFSQNFNIGNFIYQILIVILFAIQNQDPILLNYYPYKPLFLLNHGLFPTLFIIFYLSLLISKSPALQSLIWPPALFLNHFADLLFP